MNNMELAWATLTAPRAAFQELRERPRFLFPMTLTLVSTLAVLLWYYLMVDVPWLADHMLSANERMRQISDAQREQAMKFMSRNWLMWSSLIGGLVAILLMRAIEAAYGSLAGKITNVQYSYKHWFALAWWTGLPQLFGVIIMAIFLLLANTNQISNEELQLLSLNELFFHRTMGEPGFALLSNITLLHPWVWALSVIAVRVWSGRSLLFSIVFALLPSFVIYGLWALFAFRSA